MKNYIEKMSKTKALLMIFVGFAIICALSNSLFRQDFTFLTQTYHYTSEYAYGLLDRIGEAGRKAHLLILIADVIMVALYTNFLIGINYRLTCIITKNCHVISLITFLPLLLTVTQLGEIISNIIMITNYSNEYANIAHLSNTLTILKFNMTAVCFGLPIVLFCVTILMKFMEKRKMKLE